MILSHQKIFNYCEKIKSIVLLSIAKPQFFCITLIAESHLCDLIAISSTKIEWEMHPLTERKCSGRLDKKVADELSISGKKFHQLAVKTFFCLHLNWSKIFTTLLPHSECIRPRLQKRLPTIFRNVTVYVHTISVFQSFNLRKLILGL